MTGWSDVLHNCTALAHDSCVEPGCCSLILQLRCAQEELAGFKNRLLPVTSQCFYWVFFALIFCVSLILTFLKVSFFFIFFFFFLINSILLGKKKTKKQPSKKKICKDSAKELWSTERMNVFLHLCRFKMDLIFLKFVCIWNTSWKKSL